jgi:large subunit ribosomal protein L9
VYETFARRVTGRPDAVGRRFAQNSKTLVEIVAVVEDGRYESLAAQNYNIDRRRILLEDPIRQLGEYKVTVRLHKDVTVEVTVVVAKEE